jgi:hypothetical protein
MMLSDGLASERDASEGVPPLAKPPELRRTAGISGPARARPGEADGEPIGVGAAIVAPHKGSIRVTTVAAPLAPVRRSEVSGSAGPAEGRGTPTDLRSDAVPEL